MMLSFIIEIVSFDDKLIERSWASRQGDREGEGTSWPGEQNSNCMFFDFFRQKYYLFWCIGKIIH